MLIFLFNVTTKKLPAKKNMSKSLSLVNKVYVRMYKNSKQHWEEEILTYIGRIMYGVRHRNTMEKISRNHLKEFVIR